MTATDPAKQLARQLSDLTRQVSSLSRASQGANRSVEGGAVRYYDEAGSLRGYIGQLPDGTTGFVTVGGPQPPMPSAPIVEPAIGGLQIEWDGTFFEGVDAPGDLDRVEVHASPFSVYTPSDATRLTSMRKPGSTFVILPPDAYTVLFVAVSTSDVRSAPSIAATETPEKAPSYTEVIAANGKNKVFWRTDDNAPTLDGDTLVDGDLWFQGDHDNAPARWDANEGKWVEATLGDDAIAGLNVGKLTAGEIAAGQKIIAGPQFGTHAEMTDTGFYVFRADDITGQAEQVIMLGTSTDDYFAVVDRTGNLVATIDQAGGINGQDLNITNEPVFQGRPLSEHITEHSASSVGHFEGNPPTTNANGQYGPIRSQVGVAEVNGYLYPGRRYRVDWKLAWLSEAAADEVRLVMHYTGPDASGSNNAPTPLVTSPTVDVWYRTAPVASRWISENGVATFTPTVEGRHRFLIAIEKGVGAANSSVFVVSSARVVLEIQDLGPSSVNAGALTSGGGGMFQTPAVPPPPTTQQYYVDLGPVGRASYNGAGNPIGNGVDVYQGYEGYNGNTKGMFWFDLPNITGRVDRVDVYLYYRHWWFNSGGRIVMNISDARGGPANFYKFMGDWEPNVTVPKPGGVTVTVPADWWPLFRGTNNNNYNGRAMAITLGPGFGTNQNYYGIAADCRLRIWYTQ